MQQFLPISTPSPATWWQAGVIYQIYPRSFQDTDGDGVGDLPGIIDRLDYLAELGVDAVWVSPFYRSPMKDFGYDIADYRSVDPLFGALDDAERLIREAHDRGLKVIVDYVPNHTSDQHDWFIESRSSRDNPKRDWYIWHDPAEGGGVPNNWQSEFGGSAWEWDERTRQYYLHSFLEAQPDLNWRNPDVRREMMDVLRFWMDRGVDGFRIDVLWKVIKDDRFQDNPPNPNYDPDVPQSERHLKVYSENRPEVHDVARLMRDTVEEYGHRVLIGEIYLEFEELVNYYGKDLEGVHLPFNFSLILHPWDAAKVADLILRYESQLKHGMWPNWVLGNHDQSRLVSRIDREQAPIAVMLLLTLRGTSTIYYGEEIGMHDVDIPPGEHVDPAGEAKASRDPERTPMQWEPGEGAGFTTGEQWLPIADDADEVNVAKQRGDEASLLSLYQRLLAFRASEETISVGDYERVWHVDSVLAYTRTNGEKRFLVALNFSDKGATLALNEAEPGRVVLGTDRSREGEVAQDTIDLAPNEGVVVTLRPSSDR